MNTRGLMKLCCGCFRPFFVISETNKKATVNTWPHLSPLSPASTEKAFCQDQNIFCLLTGCPRPRTFHVTTLHIMEGWEGDIWKEMIHFRRTASRRLRWRWNLASHYPEARPCWAQSAHIAEGTTRNCGGRDDL